MDWARRLIRQLPDDPGRLLQSGSYANPTFLALLFDWLDEKIYRDSHVGLRWASVVPDLALKTPEEKGPVGRQEHRSQLVKAWALLGGAYRTCGDYSAADAPYDEALKVAKAGSISELVRADMNRRLSTLRLCQGQVEAALELSTGAVDSLRKFDDAPLGEALNARGVVLAFALGRYAEAINAFGEALTLAGNANHSLARKRLHETACNNMAMALSDSGSYSDLRTALLYIRAGHRLLKGQVRNPARYRLFWIEAKISERLGSHAKAERLYRRALEGFEALKLPWESARVGLDFAALLHFYGDLDELEEIASSTYKRFHLLSGADSPTLAALSLWVDAVKRRSWIIENENAVEKAKALRAYDGLHEKAREAILAGVLSGKL